MDLRFLFQIICGPISSGALNFQSQRMPQLLSQSFFLYWIAFEWKSCTKKRKYSRHTSNFTTKPHNESIWTECLCVCVCVVYATILMVRLKIDCSGGKVEVCRSLRFPCKNFTLYSFKRETLFDSCVAQRLFCNENQNGWKSFNGWKWIYVTIFKFCKILINNEHTNERPKKRKNC